MRIIKCKVRRNGGDKASICGILAGVFDTLRLGVRFQGNWQVVKSLPVVLSLKHETS